MADHYTWFDPFAARDWAEEAEDRAYYERREFEREHNMLRGALKATEAHNKHLLDALSNAAGVHLRTQPLFAPATRATA